MTDGRVSNDKAVADTSLSLLIRIREKEAEAWHVFVRLYTPLIYYWCRRRGLNEADTADIGQEVFTAVAKAIDRYEHGEKGASFRGWLRTITVNKINDLYRRRPPVADAEGGSEAHAKMLAVADQEQLDTADGQPIDDEMILLRQAVEMVLSEYEEETRKAYLRVEVDQLKPADVAKELGISVNAVYLAKSRIRRRLKERFGGLIESL